MSRIIFSIYTNNIDTDHSSTNAYKRNQFEVYNDMIWNAQKEYADLCGADYTCLTASHSSFDDVQHQKMKQLEDFCRVYDEILYIDFDVIPQTDLNWFEEHDMNVINCYWNQKQRENYFGKMNVYTKTQAKKAMLLLDNELSNDKIINTGVIGGGSSIISRLRYRERLAYCNNLLDFAKNDPMYPEEMSSMWESNNEVYTSYIIERYRIPNHEMSIAWNFMLDELCPKPTSAAHFLHHVNKDFQLSFG